MSVNAVNGLNGSYATQNYPRVAYGSNGNDSSSVYMGPSFERNPETDMFVPSERSEAEKQAIVKKARNRATFWSSGLPIGISTAYYALRSDEKIAKKYGLDVNTDKDLIDKIRKTQVKWTIPSIVGLGCLGWVASVLSRSSKIEV